MLNKALGPMVALVVGVSFVAMTIAGYGDNTVRMGVDKVTSMGQLPAWVYVGITPIVLVVYAAVMAAVGISSHES